MSTLLALKKYLEEANSAGLEFHLINDYEHGVMFNDFGVLFKLLDDVLLGTHFKWNIVSSALCLLNHYVTKRYELLTLSSFDKDRLIDKSLCYISALLEHPEVRITVQVSEVISSLCRNKGMNRFIDDLSNLLLKKINQHWFRKDITRETILGAAAEISLDDTTGWNNLESYLSAYHSMILGISKYSMFSAVNTLLMNRVVALSNQYSKSECKNIETNDDEDVKFVFASELIIASASSHINRHIRENTLRFISNLLSNSPKAKNNADKKLSEEGISLLSGDETCSAPWFVQYCESITGPISVAIASGMQDDWSQIRLAATHACMAFLVTLENCCCNNNNCNCNDCTARNRKEISSSSYLEVYWPSLLPRLCMNRFYTADAVRAISQSTWRTILGPNALGRTLLVKYCTQVAQYYAEMTTARNHMTSEAACQAIAELVSRIDRNAVQQHIQHLLLPSLCACLEDNRWPVRDAAVAATGVIVRYYPTECISVLPICINAWSNNLQDCIWSVREHAAIAFGEAMQAEDVESDVNAASQVRQLVVTASCRYISDHLLRIFDEANNSTKSAISSSTYSFIPKYLLDTLLSPPPVGNITANIDNSSSSNMNMKPKNSSSSWGCCVDCVELRSCFPWEISHGAIYLTRELLSLYPEKAFLPLSISSLCSSNDTKEISATTTIIKETVVHDRVMSSGNDISLLEAIWSLLANCSRLDSTVLLGSTKGGNNFNKRSEDNLLLLVALYEQIPSILSVILTPHSRFNLDMLQIEKLVAALSGDIGATTTDINHFVNNNTTTTKSQHRAEIKAAALQSKVIVAAENCISALRSSIFLSFEDHERIERECSKYSNNTDGGANKILAVDTSEKSLSGVAIKKFIALFPLEQQSRVAQLLSDSASLHR